MDFQGDGDMLPIEVTDWAPNPEQLYWASELRHILTQTLEAVRPPLLGILPKLVQVLEGLQKGFLNRVLRIFPVTRNDPSSTPPAAPPRSYDRPGRQGVPSGNYRLP